MEKPLILGFLWFSQKENFFVHSPSRQDAGFWKGEKMALEKHEKLAMRMAGLGMLFNGIAIGGILFTAASHIFGF